MGGGLYVTWKDTRVGFLGTFQFHPSGCGKAGRGSALVPVTTAQNTIL